MGMKTRVIVDDGAHNAFTDLVFWHGCFWLAYVSSPSHFASRKSRVVLLRSDDAHDWRKTKEFAAAGQDIRDPKLGMIGGQLFLFALLNRKFDPQPYATIVARSDDGLVWGEFEAMKPEGWLLGRPILVGEAWYAAAHRIDQGRAVLMKSSTGLDWEITSVIHEAHGAHEERADETAVHLLEDGGMLAVTRLEAGSGIFGSSRAGTLVSTSASPFSTWTALAKSSLTRLDGPNVFGVGARVFAVGRRQTRVSGPFQGQGSAFGKKRTALFLVQEHSGELVHLTDFPSSGDCSYAGVAIAAGKVVISYYSNDPRRDHPWMVGMFMPTRILVAVLDSSNFTKQEGER